MAFGSSLKTEIKKSEGTTENRVYDDPFLPRSPGRRTIRFLPVIDSDGNIVCDSSGQEITESEVRFAEYWLTVNNSKSDKGTSQLRVLVNWQTPFDNVVWHYLSKKYPPKDPNRKLAKQRFAINVFDRTSVLFAEDGSVVYPDENNEYVHMVGGRKMKITGDPVPLNRVKILEGSAGDKGGKHLLQNLITACEAVEDSNNRVMMPHQYDLRYKIAGEGMSKQYSFQLTTNFSPLPVPFLKLPRWNLKEWAVAWPDELLKALLAGEDVQEVMKSYPDVVRWPTKLIIEDNSKEQTEEIIEDPENLF